MACSIDRLDTNVSKPSPLPSAALTSLNAFSVTWSQASPGVSAVSLQTFRSWRSKAFANSFARGWFSRL